MFGPNFSLDPQQTLTDLEANLDGLEVEDGTASGVILLSETGGTAADLTGSTPAA